MSNIRTANKRHARAVAAEVARNKQPEKAPAVQAAPIKAAL